MGFFDIFRKKAIKPNESNSSCTTKTGNNFRLFTQCELEEYIETLVQISYLFRDSSSLEATGNNRNLTMMSRLHSYAGMFCYLYETYGYGQAKSILDNTVAEHYRLVYSAMNDEYNRNNSIRNLAENWSDVLNTISITEQVSPSEAVEFEKIQKRISSVTKAIEKWSGRKCVIPKHITYNPFFITENAGMSAGHSIPDISSVFAEELLPKILSCRVTGIQPEEVTRDYVISMIKSYRDNAGYVPMCIVDSLCQQIGRIAERVGVIYPSGMDLKSFVLQKNYR